MHLKARIGLFLALSLILIISSMNMIPRLLAGEEYPKRKESEYT
jgi:hypothetical protein